MTKLIQSPNSSPASRSYDYSPTPLLPPSPFPYTLHYFPCLLPILVYFCSLLVCSFQLNSCFCFLFIPLFLNSTTTTITSFLFSVCASSFSSIILLLLHLLVFLFLYAIIPKILLFSFLFHFYSYSLPSCFLSSDFPFLFRLLAFSFSSFSSYFSSHLYFPAAVPSARSIRFPSGVNVSNYA